MRLHLQIYSFVSNLFSFICCYCILYQQVAENIRVAAPNFCISFLLSPMYSNSHNF